MENKNKTEIKDFKIIQKSIPIMISAPHSAKQFRNGKVQSKESYTDYLAITLSEKENVNCIYKTAFLNDDVNIDEISGYKTELEQFINQNNIKFLIDLHTMSDKRLPDICIAINSGKNILNNYDILQEIISIFQSNGISSVTVDEPFKAKDANCISNYISTNCNIPCFQIEINKKFSSLSTKLFNKPFNTQVVESSLCSIVNALKKYI